MDKTAETVRAEAHAKEWDISCRIIAGFLRELRPDQDELTHLNNAGAIIVRLANHEPPIIVRFDGPDADYPKLWNALDLARAVLAAAKGGA